MAVGMSLRLMTGTMVLVGSIAPGITGFLATLDVLATDLPGQRLLAVDRREAPGELKRIKGTTKMVVGQPRFRYSYSFTLPGGTRLDGASYAGDPFPVYSSPAYKCRVD